MRINNKALTIIGVVTASFLAITLLQSVRASYFTLFTLTVFAAVATSYLIYYFITRRIIKLRDQLDKQTKETTRDVTVTSNGNDELSEISSSVIEIIDQFNSSHIHFEKRLHERTYELEKLNSQLQQEVGAHKFSEQRIKAGLEANTDYLLRIARHDNLNSLPNRVFFNELVNKSISHAKRHKKTFAILLIDIDNFKEVANAVSPEKSEIVLTEMGKRFSNVLRHEDVIAKLDGDEFMILLYDIAKAKFASTVAEKLLKVCSHPIKIDEQEFKLTTSIGICIYPNDGHSLETLLISSDEALYKAKHNGGNQYQFYAKDLDLEAREFIKLDSALRTALHNNEITLSYQPKIHLRNGNIASLEVLLRWEHPEFGLVDPLTFISIAEDNKTIIQIGEWALREACQTNKLWQDQGYEHFTVAVKLSPIQFYHPDMVKTIANVLAKTGLNPKYLEIELAEKTVMDDAEEALKILHAMKELGIVISMDHFGVGYTSIRYLKQFPISNIKIDRLFVKGIPNKPDDCAIVSAIIALGHVLGIEVVAEGVESAEQVQFLSKENCDMVQGYFLSHPLPAQKIVLQLSKLRDEVIV